MKNKTICFDLDGVICRTKGNDYENSKPITKTIKVINELYKNNKIIIFTARYMGRSNNKKTLAVKLAKTITTNQLKYWGVKYHKILFGKPSYDLIIDDRSIDFKKNWHKYFNKL